MGRTLAPWKSLELSNPKVPCYGPAITLVQIPAFRTFTLATTVQLGVLQFGVLQLGVLQFGVPQLGVLQLGVLQLGVSQIVSMPKQSES